MQGKTEFYYDESVPSPTPPNVSNKGAVSGGRGNLTSVHRYKDAGNFVTETFLYDDLGNVIQTTDPMSHSTTISYADRFRDGTNRNTFAFLTQVTNPQLHQTQTTYDYNTSLVTSSTDARALATTADLRFANRPRTITEPSGRLTTYTYTDSVPKVLESVQVDDAGNRRKTELTFDKFGRTITIRDLDPNGDVFRYIVYDGKGRRKQVSEPYRTGSPVWTTTTFMR